MSFFRRASIPSLVKIKYHIGMIRHITGTVFEIFPQSIIVSAQGVGYEVFSTSYLTESLTVGMPVSLWTFHALREQSSDLYGFFERSDLTFFELLLSVNGVGPKSALAIMDKASTHVIVRGIHSQDSNQLVKVVGLGKKLAEKLILSLKDKVQSHQPSGEDAQDSGQDSIDAIDALISLGFSEKQSRDAVQSMEKGMTTGAIIKKALQTLR